MRQKSYSCESRAAGHLRWQRVSAVLRLQSQALRERRSQGGSTSIAPVRDHPHRSVGTGLYQPLPRSFRPPRLPCSNVHSFGSLLWCMASPHTMSPQFTSPSSMRTALDSLGACAIISRLLSPILGFSDGSMETSRRTLQSMALGLTWANDCIGGKIQGTDHAC